jgi:hypothetical protein
MIAMPVSELLDRFTINLVKVVHGKDDVKLNAILHIIKLAPHIKFKKYKYLILPLYRANKALWILEDQMADYIKHNNEDKIVNTAIGIRETNLRRCDIKKEIATLAKENTDAAKSYN